MAPWRDALLIAADLIEQRVAAEVLAARRTIARAAEHAATCSACARLDPRFLTHVGEVLAVVVDADLDAAAIELATELELAGVCSSAGGDGADGSTA